MHEEYDQILQTRKADIALAKARYKTLESVFSINDRIQIHGIF
jgi:hypothetical protein